MSKAYFKPQNSHSMLVTAWHLLFPTDLTGDYKSFHQQKLIKVGDCIVYTSNYDSTIFSAGCNSNNTKLASTTSVQSGSGIICNQTSASTSFKQHLSTGGPQKCPYFSLAITFTKIRKPSIFFLHRYWKFIEFFWCKPL